MEIGRLRNQLIHGDYGSFSLDKTSSEIYALYKGAIRFVVIVPELLRAPLVSA